MSKEDAGQIDIPEKCSNDKHSTMLHDYEYDVKICR